MKKTAVIFFSLILMLSFTGNAIAQQKPSTEVAYAKQKGETVRFTLTSSKLFMAGGNRYILHIGNKDFFRYEQSDDNNGKGIITFFIPVSDFNGLNDGESIYLTYGHVKNGTQDMEALAKRSPRCWSLGKYSKDILTK